MEEKPDAKGGPRDVIHTLASVLSYVLNPVFLSPLAFLLILTHFGAPWREVAIVTSTAAVFFAGIPLIYIVYLVMSGKATSLELRDRTLRKGPLVLALGSAVAGIVFLTFVSRTGRPLILAISVFFLINVALSLLVTLRWKISLHMIGLAGFLATCLFVAFHCWPWSGAETILAPRLMLAFLATLPILGWARVRSGAHTPRQVVAGGVAGFMLPLVELWLVVDLIFRDLFPGV